MLSPWLPSRAQLLQLLGNAETEEMQVFSVLVYEMACGPPGSSCCMLWTQWTLSVLHASPCELLLQLSPLSADCRPLQSCDHLIPQQENKAGSSGCWAFWAVCPLGSEYVGSVEAEWTQRTTERCCRTLRWALEGSAVLQSSLLKEAMILQDSSYQTFVLMDLLQLLVGNSSNPPAVTDAAWQASWHELWGADYL